MCGRFNLRTSNTEFFRMFGADFLLSDRFNICPAQTIPIVRGVGICREAVASTWGLVPCGAKSRWPMFNANSETARDLPTFRSAFLGRRCLIPATGFYEWETNGKKRLPWHFTLKDLPLFAFAGLWEGEAEPTCTILTTSANPMLARLLERMPVILRPGDYAAWLAEGELPPEVAAGMFQPFPADEMHEERANPFMNSARNEGPDCLMTPKKSE
jgi:putative SOS response-associated peptidase YedK